MAPWCLAQAVKAALYLRISQDKTGQAAGVRRQEEDCRKKATELGWTVAEVYRENDTSAVSSKGRPLFKRMLADIEAGTIDAIVCWHPDRLYRRAVDLLPLVETCKKYGTQIATVTAGDLDLSTPSGRMLAGILAQIATYEGEHKSERYRRSIRQKRESGAFAPSGRRMYGYTPEGDVIPDEADTVRGLFKAVLEGATVTGLCHKLNANGSFTTQGNEWRTTNLKGYLLNPKLAGYATIGGEIIGTGEHEAIVDAETWEQVRALLSTSKSGWKVPVRKALLPGLVVCGLCGKPMVTGQRPPKVRTYRCSKAPGHHGCGKVSIDAEPVEHMVETMARRWLDDPRTWSELSALRSTEGASDLAAESAALEQRIVELENAMAEPGVPVNVLLRQIDKARTRHAELQEALAAVAPMPDFARGEWPDDLGRRRRLVGLVIRHALIDPVPPGVRGRFVPERVRIVSLIG